MYSNLRAEMTRYEVPVEYLAKACDVSRATIYNKLRGISEFRLGEMETIKEMLDVVSGKNFSLEYLFNREV